MSHYSLLVVLPSTTPVKYEEIDAAVHANMQPFHQFESTRIVDEHVVEIDLLPNAREAYEAFKAKYGDDPAYGEFTDTLLNFIQYEWSPKLVGDGEEIDRDGEHRYGWVRVNRDGVVTEYIARTNPNAKWDYWRIGGRWTGLLAVPNGASFSRGGRYWPWENDGSDPYACDDTNIVFCDAARKADLVKVIPSLQAYRAEQARRRWAEAQGEDRRLWKLKYGIYSGDCEESYVERNMTMNPFMTYSLLWGRQWYDRDDSVTGIFSMHCEDSLIMWASIFAPLWDMIPEDAVIAVVDYHM